MAEKELDTFCPDSRKDWRKWLIKNHLSKQSVWLIYYKKKSKVTSLNWSEAVEEALCFGWIDSKAKPLDEEKFMQFFSRRKPNGTWSKINKEKIKLLTAAGLMAPAGLDIIEKAKQNGSWTILDDVEELILPKDLLKEFRSRPGSKTYFLSLSKSTRKSMLQWLVLSKLPETRQKRIKEIVERAGMKQKPKQFR